MVILLVHHAVADGVGFMIMMSGMQDQYDPNMWVPVGKMSLPQRIFLAVAQPITALWALF